MAAKTFLGAMTHEIKLVTMSYQRVWDAATEAAEEKFNSAAQSGPTNTQSKQALREIAERLNEVSEVADDYAPGTMKVELQALARQLLAL